MQSKLPSLATHTAVGNMRSFDDRLLSLSLAPSISTPFFFSPSRSISISVYLSGCISFTKASSVFHRALPCVYFFTRRYITVLRPYTRNSSAVLRFYRTRHGRLSPDASSSISTRGYVHEPPTPPATPTTYFPRVVLSKLFQLRRKKLLVFVLTGFGATHETRRGADATRVRSPCSFDDRR